MGREHDEWAKDGKLKREKKAKKKRIPPSFAPKPSTGGGQKPEEPYQFNPILGF